MEGSHERVKAVLEGRRPDRPPLFDLIRNDAIIEHFSGVRPLTPANGDELVMKAFPLAVDASRPEFMAPQEPGEERLPDGRGQVLHRWTTWTEHRTFPDAETFARYVKEKLDARSESNDKEAEERVAGAVAGFLRTRERLGGDAFFLVGGAPSVGLMGVYGLLGIEQFSYFLYDCEEAILSLLRHNTARAVAFFENLPPDHGIEAVFCGDDIAYKTGLIVNPKWMRAHHFPLLKQVCDACHRQGIRVMFHSDGNLNEVMDDLVEAGIDALNPVEVAAGMDLADLHKRCPDLVFAGGIDVSNLLPYGTPQQVRDAVVKAVDDTEGRILVGSSTELHDDVPLQNFLAMREAALGYRF